MNARAAPIAKSGLVCGRSPACRAAVTGLDLGGRQPKALGTAGDDVWVIAADGTALRVDPGT